MWLIVGLGNPGKQYEGTRHNAGWIALDFIADEIGAEWREEKKWNSVVADGTLEGQKVLFVKPQNFMNVSGEAVQPIAAFYKIAPDNIIVVHDDLDFTTGVVKTQFDRSAAAHNGVQSVIDRLGTQTFHRVRIGIGPKMNDAADFVLMRFTSEERTLIDAQLDNISDVVRKIVAAK